MSAARRFLRPLELLVTCEHGGNRVPARYRAAFANAARVLASHRAYDPGALELARQFARRLQAPLVYSTTSRLLVELNRSLHHPQLFSTYSRRLPPELRQEILQRYYEPYRRTVERHVGAAVQRGRRVVHVSCHSFTPRFRRVVRTADIGLLFDPRRSSEPALCERWRAELARADPQLRVRRNYPYRGWADGLTTTLRAKFADADYVGIELEVNQKFPLGRAERWRAVREALVESFEAALAKF